MQRGAEEVIYHRMEDLRLACVREIQTQRDKAGLAASSFRHSLGSIRSLAEQNLADREKLGSLKDSLKELETNLGEVLSVKTGKESKSSTLAEALSTTTCRTEQLKKRVLDMRRKRDEYTAVISEQLDVLEAREEKSSQDVLERQKIEEAIDWYNKILGFRAECGQGVKFIFNKVDLKNPDDDYSFSIRLENDVYKLLDCNPYLDGIIELIQDLNKTNNLFKFARIMREKFQDAALKGVIPASMPVCPDSTLLMLSSAPPVSMDSRNETSVIQSDVHVQAKDRQSDIPKKATSKRAAILSPNPMSSLRRSPRLLERKG